MKPSWFCLILSIALCVAVHAQSSPTIAVGAVPGGVAVNSETNTIYVTNTGDGTVSAINGATNSVTATISVGTQPLGIVVNPATNRVYVADTQDNTVAVIDGNKNVVTDLVSLAASPEELAVDPLSNQVYAMLANGTLAVIDAALDSVATTIPVTSGNAITALALNPITHKIYCAAFTGQLFVVDDATNAVTSVSVPTRPAFLWVTVNSSTNKIYAGGTGIAYVLDGATNAFLPLAQFGLPATTSAITGLAGAVNPVTNTLGASGSGTDSLVNLSQSKYSDVTNPTSGEAVAFNPLIDQFFFVNTGGNSVNVIDGTQTLSTGGLVVNTVSVGTKPVAVGADPVTDRAYVVNQGSNNVSVIDGANYFSPLVVTNTSSATAVNPVTDEFYVPETSSEDVRVINGATNANSTIAAGTNPVGVAVNPLTNTAYVANNGSKDVTVIDGATKTPVATIPLSTFPVAIAADPLTNKIYVLGTQNNIFNTSYTSPATVTIIDGATNHTSVISIGSVELFIPDLLLAVNQATNKIYVANSAGSSVTVIDGVTNQTTSIATADGPDDLAINPVTNKIYASTFTNGITVIDGATNSATATISLGNTTAIQTIAVNPETNRLYASTISIANPAPSVTVFDGATNQMIATGGYNSSVAVQPGRVIVNPATDTIYVTAYMGARLEVLDGLTNSFVQPLPIEEATTASYGALNPATGHLVTAGPVELLIDEEKTQNFPLTVNIAPLPDNQTTSSSPSFSFTAANSFDFGSNAVQAVYYQMDTREGVWTSAASNGDGTYSGSASRLQPGMHILYAFATDGQDSSPASGDLPGTESSPLVGKIAAYVFFVMPQAAAMQSITVKPSPDSLAVGASVQFTAVATYTDGSAQDVTDQATWSSSNAAATDIDAAGLAQGLGTGTSTINASLSGVSGSSTVTVFAPAYNVTVVPIGAIGTNSNGNYVVQLVVINQSNVALASVSVTSASLNSTAPVSSSAGLSATPLPASAQNVGPGKTAYIVLDFPASAGVPGSRGLLYLQGSYASSVPGATGAFNGNFRVNLP